MSPSSEIRAAVSQRETLLRLSLCTAGVLLLVLVVLMILFFEAGWASRQYQKRHQKAAPRVVAMVNREVKQL